MSLAAERVVVSRGGRRLLYAASVEVRPGELLCVLGPNGAGKSTLVNTLAGDIVPDTGMVTLDGRALTELSEPEQAERRAVMAQAQPPVFGFTVEDVVRMGWVRGNLLSGAALQQEIRARLQACDVAGLAGRALNTLSGGEQQRVHFARALLQIRAGQALAEPRYLLLDEPTSNLDLVHQRRLLGLARDAARSGVGVLAVLHDLNLAAGYADRIVLLKDGRVECAGAPAEVLEADRLSAVYGTSIHVEHHPALDRLVVLA
ncbi:MAG: heme ABC transporter ATP-binding protein [Gammaproteobacteria bacterium]|jgi:iron complex transport system ATP-binding protein|nr:heme ABC transporter ATP-binding protein [Gammaproteobacteria bacterium]